MWLFCICSTEINRGLHDYRFITPYYLRFVDSNSILIEFISSIFCVYPFSSPQPFTWHEFAILKIDVVDIEHTKNYQEPNRRDHNMYIKLVKIVRVCYRLCWSWRPNQHDTIILSLTLLTLFFHSSVWTCVYVFIYVCVCVCVVFVMSLALLSMLFVLTALFFRKYTFRLWFFHVATLEE